MDSFYCQTRCIWWATMAAEIKALFAENDAHLSKVPSVRLPSHLLSATVRVYSLVAPCRLPDLTSLAQLGSVSGQRRPSRGPLPGYKVVSKWGLQLQDSTPYFHKDFAPFFTPQHLWDVISCLLSCQTAPWHLLVKSDSSNLCFVRL